jgi:YVTN family beta-propeller protein
MNQQDIILITGATGTQGGAVARQLLAKGYKVRALVRQPDSEKAKALSAIWQGDSLSVVDLQRQQVIRTIPTGNGPETVAYTVINY